MGRRIALGFLGFAVFVALWQMNLWFGILSDRIAAFPSTLVGFLMARPPLVEFYHAMLTSAGQLAAGFAIAAVAGIALGLLLGWYRRAGALFEPLLIAVNAVPLIALVPLLVVLLGLGLATELVVIVLFAFFPIYFAVSSAAAATDPQLVRMCRSFGGRDVHLVRDIVLPSVLPAMTTGLRLAIGRALTGLVVVELFMGRGGLGSVILDATNRGQPNLALLAVVVLCTVNMLAAGSLQLLQARIETWRPGRQAS
ncbi:MAG: ABC transporter permease subunit [Rhodospirillales bacterium]|nr:ABC transporter permease subunit [Rhodospirillales bacterium]